LANSTIMQVMLSAPSPSQVIRLVAQFLSIIISTVQARPLNLLAIMLRSKFVLAVSADFYLVIVSYLRFGDP